MERERRESMTTDGRESMSAGREGRERRDKENNKQRMKRDWEDPSRNLR